MEVNITYESALVQNKRGLPVLDLGWRSGIEDNTFGSHVSSLVILFSFQELTFSKRRYVMLVQFPNKNGDILDELGAILIYFMACRFSESTNVALGFRTSNIRFKLSICSKRKT